MTPIFVPHLHLFRDHAVVGGTGAFESTAAALARLVFDYGGTRVPMSDDREVFYRSTPEGLTAIRRDRHAEHAACARLESFGAVEIACLQDVAVEDAHY